MGPSYHRRGGPHRRRLPLFRATKPSRNVRAVRARKASLWAPLAEAICACRRVYTVIDSSSCEMTVLRVYLELTAMVPVNGTRYTPLSLGPWSVYVHIFP